MTTLTRTSPSKIAAALAVAALGGLPIEPVDDDDQASFRWPPQDVTDRDHRILDVGRDHVEIFAIEGGKLEHVHGDAPSVLAW